MKYSDCPVQFFNTTMTEKVNDTMNMNNKYLVSNIFKSL